MSATPLVEAPAWTPRSTLTYLEGDRWHEGDPATGLAAPLPDALQNSRTLTFSPDGKQAFFYRGSQLWTAGRDGSGAKLVGEGLTGRWAPDSTLVTVRAEPAPAATRSIQTAPGARTGELIHP